jgi:carboxyl-terminal processing protease
MVRRILVMSTVTALVLAGFIAGSLYSAFTPASVRKIGDVLKRVERDFPGEVAPEKLERAAIEGMLETTDPWGHYFTAAEWREFNERLIQGKLTGVGIRFEQDKGGYIRVVTPIENSPALAAGLMPGDLVVKVDGVDMKNRPTDDVVSRIKGDAGTKVTLTIHRGATEPFDVPLVRAEIKIRNVKHKMAAPGFGYIRVEEFSEGVSRDVEEAVKDLSRQELKALILDLRFNTGGLLSEAVQMCDLWLPEGKVVTKSVGKSGEKELKTRSDDAFKARPLVILTNKGTASASEIVAGALRDHGLASLVGARTYGKGQVQSTFELSDGSFVKLTTARWLTPNGDFVSAKDEHSEGGIPPQHRVEMTPEEETALLRRWAAEGVINGPPLKDPPPRDYALEAALEVLRAKLEARAPKVETREVPKADAKAP